MSDISMQKIIQAVYEAGGPGEHQEIEKQASVFLKKTFVSGTFPSELFEFLVEIFSSDILLSKVGINSFVNILLISSYCLSEEQKIIFIKILMKNYYKYSNLEMCWMLGDIIARNYEIDVAIDTFGALFPVATEQGKEGIALGLDIVARAADDYQMEKIKRILKSG